MVDFGRVNLLPVRLRPKQVSLREHPALRVAAVAMIFVAIIGLSIYQTLSTTRAEAELAKLEQQQKQLTLKISEFTGKQKAAEAEGMARETLIQMAQGKILWSQIFKTLSLATPKGIWLNQLTQSELPSKELKLLLVGEAPSQTAVAALMKSLEDSPHFTQVTLKFSEQLESFDPILFRFQVEFILSAPKEMVAHRG